MDVDNEAPVVQDRILELAAEIRQFTNDTGQQLMFECIKGDSGMLEEWVAICLAMDTLEDATGALRYYQQSGVGGVVHERRLRIYGMFQAAVLQQQAILRLYELFVGSELIISRNSSWTRISEVYKLAVRGPLEGWRPNRNRTKLSQINITEDGFYISVWDRDTWDNYLGEMAPARIDPVELLDEYSEEALGHLREIAQSLESLRA